MITDLKAPLTCSIHVEDFVATDDSENLFTGVPGPNGIIDIRGFSKHPNHCYDLVGFLVSHAAIDLKPNPIPADMAVGLANQFLQAKYGGTAEQIGLRAVLNGLCASKAGRRSPLLQKTEQGYLVTQFGWDEFFPPLPEEEKPEPPVAEPPVATEPAKQEPAEPAQDGLNAEEQAEVVKIVNTDEFRDALISEFSKPNQAEVQNEQAARAQASVEAGTNLEKETVETLCKKFNKTGEQIEKNAVEGIFNSYLHLDQGRMLIQVRKLVGKDKWKEWLISNVLGFKARALEKRLSFAEFFDVCPEKAAHLLPLPYTTACREIQDDPSSKYPIIGTHSVVSGTPFSQAIQSQNATLFSATGLPSGLSINPKNGLISGIPTAIGTFSITISALNENTKMTASGILKLTVTQPVQPVDKKDVPMPPGLAALTALTATEKGAKLLRAAFKSTLEDMMKDEDEDDDEPAMLVRTAMESLLADGKWHTYAEMLQFGEKIPAERAKDRFKVYSASHGERQQFLKGISAAEKVNRGRERAVYSLLSSQLRKRTIIRRGEGRNLWEFRTAKEPAPQSTPPPVSNMSAIVGTEFNTRIRLPSEWPADTNKSALSFYATGLPDGLAVDAKIGVISGKPKIAGMFTIYMSIKDSEHSDRSGHGVLKITVSPPVLPPAPPPQATPPKPLPIEQEDLDQLSMYLSESQTKATLARQIECPDQGIEGR